MDHAIANIVGNNIKRLRVIKKWSQADLAKKIGAPAQLISKYERGGHTPGSVKLNQLAQALEVNVSELTRAEGEPRTVAESPPAYNPTPRLSPHQIDKAKTFNNILQQIFGTLTTEGQSLVIDVAKSIAAYETRLKWRE